MTSKIWQPIETAPKDGQEIVVLSKKSKSCVVVVWQNSKRYVRPSGWFISDGEDGICTDDGDFYVVNSPTHWMPLPEFPE